MQLSNFRPRQTRGKIPIYLIFESSNIIISHVLIEFNMSYRTSMQIVADMLYQTEQCGHEGIKTTTLLTKANLSHSRLEKFVKNLTGAGLMNKIEYDGSRVLQTILRSCRYFWFRIIKLLFVLFTSFAS
jgi:predicted transcriptional regulator